jgi:hypothetical protein
MPMPCDLDIPFPPNALIVGTHRISKQCLGIVTQGFDAQGRMMALFHRERIATYKLWTGNSFHLCDAAFCELRWYII